jgi:hypothetical protein
MAAQHAYHSSRNYHMVKIPIILQGPWSTVGYLLLAHVMQREPKHECLDLEWVARTLDMTVYQLKSMLHRDNNQSDVWLPDMLNRLREQGYPEMVIFEQGEHMHYTVANPLDYHMEIVMKKSGMSWTSKNGR